MCDVSALPCDKLQALGPERTPSNFAQEEMYVFTEQIIRLLMNVTQIVNYSRVLTRHVCILCQEEQSLSDLTKPFVLAAYVQRSSVFCQDRARLMSEVLWI